MPAPAPRRDQVFISYSHKDKKWLDRLHTMLKPLVRKGVIDLWDDTRAGTGQKWRKEIRKALTRTKVAVLLVSDNFLASDFIAKHELPPLLEAAEDNSAVIFWIAVSPCLYEETEIVPYQAANDPGRPLDQIRGLGWKKELKTICLKLIEAYEKPL